MLNQCRLLKIIIIAFLLNVSLIQTIVVLAQESTTLRIGPSGLPLPRFVSLKSSKVNVRVGPGSNYEVVWTFIHSKLPVEVISEYEHWRHIRDWFGNEGWIFHSLLSSKRTALVLPWSRSLAIMPLYHEANEEAKLIAQLEAGKLVDIIKCDESWCRIETEGADSKIYRGYVKQNQLWGTYPGEEID